MLRIKMVLLGFFIMGTFSQMSFAKSSYTNNSPFKVLFSYKYWYFFSTGGAQYVTLDPQASTTRGDGNANIINGACAAYMKPGVDGWTPVAREGIDPKNPIPPGGNCYTGKISNPQTFEIYTITDKDTGEIYPIYKAK